MQLTEVKPLVAGSLQEAADSNSCLVWEVRLPHTCTPPHCRLGFERRDDVGVILIDNGIQYRGHNTVFQRFLEQGEFTFTETSELNRFLDAFDAVVAEDEPPEPSEPPQQLAHFDRERFIEFLKAEVKGQDEVIGLLAPLVFSAVRKRRPARPLAIVFAGRPGVGKTLLATKLAEAINAAWATGSTTADGPAEASNARNNNTADQPSAAPAGQAPAEVAYGTIRVDMNQLGEPHNTSRFWGSPPGYVGHDEAALFDTLLLKKRQVVVFDEMEKASPDVLSTLMNALASGRMEAARVRPDGTREFDFRQAIMIFTTNIPLVVTDGQPQYKKTLSCKQQLRNRTASGTRFLPEIVNRFSEIVVFSDLTPAVEREVAELSICRLARQFELDVESIDAGLLSAFTAACILEEGVREFEYMAERVFGYGLAAYDEAASGVEAPEREAERPAPGPADYYRGIETRLGMVSPDLADDADEGLPSRRVTVSGSLADPLIEAAD
ncbi:MAG: AAA family ATPase [Coriobacteriia bacterium]|nr:AAA family ATPase [Coriobacteriia bacterium]